jgi:ketosteroid isomerase-like protein
MAKPHFVSRVNNAKGQKSMLEGKGIYIWKIHNCEGGNVTAIVRRAIDAGLSHVLIKIADGPRAYNVDLATPLVEALKGAGILVWGWQFVYGNEPFGEADIAVHRVQTLGLDGFVINAEVDYKYKNAAAAAYMDSLRPRLGQKPIALSSFRYPRYHPELPWTEFLSQCDINMPQVYWLQANNPAEQTDTCIAQFQNVFPVKPIVPTGAAFEEWGWRPTAAQVQTFLSHAQEIGLSAVNFWSWDYAGSAAGRDLWDTIASFAWPITQPLSDLSERLFAALNRGDINGVVALYQPNAVLITAQQTYQGHTAIRQYYTNLLQSQLSGAQFTVETRVFEGNIRHIQWDAVGASNGRSVRDGQDTLGSRQGLIQYHSSVYRII